MDVRLPRQGVKYHNGRVEAATSSIPSSALRTRRPCLPRVARVLTATGRHKYTIKMTRRRRRAFIDGLVCRDRAAGSTPTSAKKPVGSGLPVRGVILQPHRCNGSVTTTDQAKVKAHLQIFPDPQWRPNQAGAIDGILDVRSRRPPSSSPPIQSSHHQSTSSIHIIELMGRIQSRYARTPK